MKYKEGQGQATLSKNFVAQACTRLSTRETHILYVTIQYNNRHTPTSVRDCVAQQPVYRSKIFQQKKKL